MKKLKNLKARLLSLSLAFAMVLSLAMGMAPMEVQAAEPPTLDELKNTKTSTFEATLTVGDEYIQCSELPTVKNENYKWVYCYIPNTNYEEAYEGYKSYLGSVLGGMMKNADMIHSEALDCLIVDMPEDLKIPVSSKSYGILCILQVYDYKWIDSNNMERYYFNQAAVFDVSRGGTVSNGLSGGEPTPPPAESYEFDFQSKGYSVNGNSAELRVKLKNYNGTIQYDWYKCDANGDNPEFIGTADNPNGDFVVSNDSYGVQSYICKVKDSSDNVIATSNVITMSYNQTAGFNSANLEASGTALIDFLNSLEDGTTPDDYTLFSTLESLRLSKNEVKDTNDVLVLLDEDYPNEFRLAYRQKNASAGSSWTEYQGGAIDKTNYDYAYLCAIIGSNEYAMGPMYQGNQSVDSSKISFQSNTMAMDSAWTNRNGRLTVALIPKSTTPVTYGITLDRTNYPEGYVELYTYASDGSNVATTQINNTTIQMPEGGKVRIFASEDFTVTAVGATISERLDAGEEGYYYELTSITADTTVVVNKVTSGSGGSNPPAPAPTPDSGNNGGNSSSSSSSSSSSTPSTSAPITVPVSNGDDVLNINASLSGEKASVSELTADEINKVAKNETEKSIEINLSDTGKKVKEAALPVSSLNEIARIMDDPSNKLDNVTIKLSTATVEVSEHTLKAVLSKTTGNDLRLVVDDVQKDTLNNTQKEAVKNQNVHQCIDAYFISNGVRIGDFQGGTVTIRLPFNVPEGLNGNGFSVWYVGDDGRIEKHDTQYVNGELVFTVSHFSDYVVVYDDAVKDDVPKTGEAADYSTMLWTSILAIGVVGLVLNRQKKRQ